MHGSQTHCCCKNDTGGNLQCQEVKDGSGCRLSSHVLLHGQACLCSSHHGDTLHIVPSLGRSIVPLKSGIRSLFKVALRWCLLQTTASCIGQPAQAPQNDTLWMQGSSSRLCS